MCGIFGVWNFKNTKGSHLLKASELLKHRGSDDEGILVFENNVPKAYSGLASANGELEKIDHQIPSPNALLHRRLSIIDTSPAGHQPMSLADRNIHIVFNGTIYNFRELIDQYDLRPKSQSDTEVILLLYAKIGTEAFSKFRGAWAIAILDLEKNKLVLCRDRFGIKPLMYTKSNGGLAFSSEAKPLLILPGMKTQWQRKKFLQFLVYGATDNPHETYFEDVHALKPGHFQTYDLDTLDFEEVQYYNLRQRVADGEYTQQNFDTLFHESIREHLVSDVEVGSCLSGGLDSSLIVAASANIYSHELQTFTCSFPGEAIDESKFARMMATENRKLEQHFTTPVSQAFFQGFDELIRTQERPIGSASIFAQSAVMKLASESGIRVLLDGQGADEILGGYYPFAGAYLISLLKAGKFAAYKSELKALKTRFNPKMETAMMRSAFYAMPQKLQFLARKQNRLGYGLIALEFQSQARSLKSPDRGATDFLELSLKSVEFGLYELLQYADKNSMKYGIETRVPFLDHRLVEWSIGQNAEVKIHDGWTKYPIRKALEEYDLPALAWRLDKLGFVAPQDRWRLELAEELANKMQTTKIPKELDANKVQELFSKSITDNSGLSEFWRIFSLLRWLEVFEVELV